MYFKASDSTLALKSLGGFAIADIDRDDDIEIIFGTSDGKIHCWELGTCDTGYAPPMVKFTGLRRFLSLLLGRFLFVLFWWL